MAGRPLILGSGGRVGTMFRRLAADGLWPGPEPLFHTRDGREGTLAWDLEGPLPPAWTDLSGVRGIIVLAGRTSEHAAMAQAETLARIVALGNANGGPVEAALALASDHPIGPVLACSSAAVYGTAPGPSREDDRVEPTTIYGKAKLYMEEDIQHWRWTRDTVPPACALRIGNVAGADALFGAMARGPVTLDRLPDGAAPRRACIGPLTLARALVALLARDDLPPVLNLAQPGLVAMDAILDAAGHPFAWRDAPPSALPALEMDLARLMALAPLPPATPEGLVAEARLAGWRTADGMP